MIKVNTDAVVLTAQHISKINDDIDKLFSPVQDAIRDLDVAWESSAATAAISKYNSMKSQYYDNRHKVIENFVNFLLRQVGEGYDQTETVNTSLADAFK